MVEHDLHRMLRGCCKTCCAYLSYVGVFLNNFCGLKEMQHIIIWQINYTPISMLDWYIVTMITAWRHYENNLESPIRVQERTIQANGTWNKFFISKGINWGYGFQEVGAISGDCGCQYRPHFLHRNDERGISGTLTWVIILVKFLQAFQRSQ